MQIKSSSVETERAIQCLRDAWARTNSNWFHSNAQQWIVWVVSPSVTREKCGTGAGKLNAFFPFTYCTTASRREKHVIIIASNKRLQVSRVCNMQVAGAMWMKSKRADDNPEVPRRADSIQPRARAFFCCRCWDFEWSEAAPAQQACHIHLHPPASMADSSEYVTSWF